MDYDKNLANLFLLNFNEAYRSAKLLMMSYNRTAKLFPLKAEILPTLNLDDLDKLDAFRVRYCDVQDSLDNKTFRSILMLEEENVGSNLDILNKMEKREILRSFEEWKELREIRNLFSHDYPETEEEKAEILNLAYTHTLQLVVTLDRVIEYMKKKLDFTMNQFPFLVLHMKEE
ncbi:MAG: hypothetical protein LLF94_03985 [Chlamydiales bacterium]|nr:hypothetical protein [Chlamydiales bacterium]